MRGPRTDVAVALALVALVAVVGLLRGAGERDDEDPRRSTFSDARRGLHALHLVLDEIGAKPRRSLAPASRDDPTDVTLVVAEPSEPVTRRETAELVLWVERGGRLVLVCGSPATGRFESYAKPVLDAFGLVQKDHTRHAGDETAISDPALAEGQRLLDWPAAWRLERTAGSGEDDGFRALVGSAGATLVALLPRGQSGGELVAVADARLLDNESLGKADNAVLAARLLLGRGAVVFDEFHHGFRADGTDGRIAAVLLAMLRDTWTGRAVLVLLLAGLVYVAGAAVRLGAPLPEPAPPRRSLSEHAEALGRIFETAAARRETLAILAAGARRVVATRTGIPAALPAAEFVRRLRGSAAPGASEMADALDAAASPRTAKDVEMAALAANLAAAKRRFALGGLQ